MRRFGSRVIFATYEYVSQRAKRGPLVFIFVLIVYCRNLGICFCQHLPPVRQRAAFHSKQWRREVALIDNNNNEDNDDNNVNNDNTLS